MRITHVITRLIVGGAQENTIATVLGLRSKPDCSVSLITGPTTGPEGSLEHHVSSVPNVLTIIPTLIRPVRPWIDLQCLQQLTALIRAQQPDIVHTHSGKAGILGRIAAHRACVPVVVHSIHGPSFGTFQGWFANALFRAAERYAARYTTHFIAVAQAMAEQYLAAGIGRPDQFTRIWSGFNLDPFLSAHNSLALRKQFGIAETDVVIGKIARFFELKGHDDLFAFAPELVRAVPHVKFLLVGDGVLRPQFEARARDLRLSKHFIFTGLVPPGEIPPLVGIMDILVHLSTREGLARALPQAMAAAKPVVTYDCGGAREVCIDGETGFLLPQHDLAGLTDRLRQLAQNPALRLRLGLSAQTRVRDAFSIRTMVDDQFALYQNLLTTSRQSGKHG